MKKGDFSCSYSLLSWMEKKIKILDSLKNTLIEGITKTKTHIKTARYYTT